MTFSSELNPHVFKFKRSHINDFIPAEKFKQPSKGFSDKKKKWEDLKLQDQDLIEDVEMETNEEVKISKENLVEIKLDADMPPSIV